MSFFDELARQPTLAAKATDAKPKARFDLIPARFLFALAEHYRKGSEKYSDNEWRNGRPWGDYYGAAKRHLVAWWEGETFDEDGHHNLIAAAWCCASLYIFEKIHPELDNRPEERDGR